MTCSCGTETTSKHSKCGGDWLDFKHCPACGRVEFLEAQIDGAHYTGTDARAAWSEMLKPETKLAELLS